MLRIRSASRAVLDVSHVLNKSLIAVAASMVVLASCTGDDAVRPARARRVILITCDTLRADHLGCYGHARDTTPNIDAFAHEAVRYDEAYSCAPMTVPSLSALMTGRLPQEVGAGANNRQLMGADAQTMAELFKNGGIATAAFVSNGVLRRPPQAQSSMGVAQGFQHFDDTMNSPERNRSLVERTADACADAAIAWIKTRDVQERLFLWVHFQDPHGPYTPPPEFAARFPAQAADTSPRIPVGTTQLGFQQLPAYQFVPEPGDAADARGPVSPAVYRARYEAEIAYFDSQLGRLLAAIRERGWWDDSLIVFSADHGESLGEHEHWFCHGESLSRELVHVPLIVKFPAADARDRAPAIERVASHLDLWPTFLEAFGFAATEARGVSLFARELPIDRVVMQTLGVSGKERYSIAVGDEQLRLITDSEGVEHLFDNRSDAGEEHDLASEQPDVVRSLRERGAEFVRRDTRPTVLGAPRELDRAGRDALRGLGYTDADK